jgi:hypothetical protein
MALTETEVQAIERERDAWKELALVRGAILAVLPAGLMVPGPEPRLLERAGMAKAALRRLGFKP